MNTSTYTTATLNGKWFRCACSRWSMVPRAAVFAECTYCGNTLVMTFAPVDRTPPPPSWRLLAALWERA